MWDTVQQGIWYISPNGEHRTALVLYIQVTVLVTRVMGSVMIGLENGHSDTILLRNTRRLRIKAPIRAGSVGIP